MRPLLCLPLICAMTACAAPSLQPELDAFARDAMTANTALAAYAKPLAAQETARARAGRIAQNLPVADLAPECGIYKARQTGVSLADCRLTDKVAGDRDNGIWSSTLDFSAALDAYLLALQALVAAKGPTEIGIASTALLSETATLAEQTGNGAASAQLAKLAGPAGALATRVAEARRSAVLRKAITAADPNISKGIGRTIEAIDARNPQVQRAYDELQAADSALTDALEQKSPAAHRAALARLRDSHAAYVAAERPLPTASLLALREAHAALLRAVRRDATRAELITLLDDLNALKSAL